MDYLAIVARLALEASRAILPEAKAANKRAFDPAVLLACLLMRAEIGASIVGMAQLLRSPELQRQLGLTRPPHASTIQRASSHHRGDRLVQRGGEILDARLQAVSEYGIHTRPMSLFPPAA
jgi:hypothetical protein